MYLDYLTHSGTQDRTNNLKGAWVRPIYSSWRASQRGRGQLELTLGTQTLLAAIFGS